VLKQGEGKGTELVFVRCPRSARHFRCYLILHSHSLQKRVQRRRLTLREFKELDLGVFTLSEFKFVLVY
jgi:hypothetical protein